MIKNDKRQIDKHAIVSADTKIIGAGELTIGPHTIVEAGVLIDLGIAGSVYIGPRTKLKYGCVIRSYDGNIRIGSRSTIGEYSILAGHGGLTIGDAVIIAGHCYLSAAEHIFSGKDHIRFQGELAKGIRVGDGAWIGARCVVLDGVVIGCGGVIGAGSVVTRNIEKNMVCYGNPCRSIYPRNHYTEEE